MRNMNSIYVEDLDATVVYEVFPAEPDAGFMYESYEIHSVMDGVGNNLYDDLTTVDIDHLYALITDEELYHD